MPFSAPAVHSGKFSENRCEYETFQCWEGVLSLNGIGCLSVGVALGFRGLGGLHRRFLTAGQDANAKNQRQYFFIVFSLVSFLFFTAGRGVPKPAAIYSCGYLLPVVAVVQAGKPQLRCLLWRREEQTQTLFHSEPERLFLAGKKGE